MSAADLLKAVEGSPLYQGLMILTAALILGWQMLKQFSEGTKTEPPPKPGQASVELLSLDGSIGRELVAETRGCRVALEKIAGGLDTLNRLSEREERKALLNLVKDFREEVRDANEKREARESRRR